MNHNKVSNAFILGASSDIALDMLPLFEKNEISVFGTYRRASGRAEVFVNNDQFVECDVTDSKSCGHAIEHFTSNGRQWDLFLSAVGQMKPIGRFFDLDFDQWARTVETNTLAQLRILHQLYPHRKVGQLCHAVFFAGGGTNGPFPNYSAYCASKIFLIKMCELIDDECPDLNAFIIGPGWVYSKIHNETVEASQNAGENYEKTKGFLSSGEKGTPVEDIFSMMMWGVANGKASVGGRNFSVVHDAWKTHPDQLLQELSKNGDMYKLRRFGNDWGMLSQR